MTKKTNVFTAILTAIAFLCIGIGIGLDSATRKAENQAKSLASIQPIVAPVQTAATPRVIIETLDHSLLVYEDAWKKEVGRRFSNAAVILVHGGDFVAGE